MQPRPTHLSTVLTTVLILLVSFHAKAQSLEGREREVMKVIFSLFEGMRQGDSTMVRAAFTQNARMYTILERNGQPSIREEGVQKFIEAVGTPHPEVWDEPLWDYTVQIDGNLAHVWTKYAFYLDDKFLHCGVDDFQLYYDGTSWKIFISADTRQREGCNLPPAYKMKRKL